MISRPLADITEKDLLELISNGVKEGRKIEYKLELNFSTDSDRKELLSDVSSFANAGGGDIVYGISEKDGIPVAIEGLKNFNSDKSTLALEGSLRDCIDPRIPGIQFRTVQCGAGEVLIVRIPRSWAGPHMVTFKGSSRFYTRSTNGKYEMDVREIRAAFLQGGQLTDRISNWRLDRVGRVVSGEGSLPLRENVDRFSGFLILHIIPLSSFDTYGELDLSTSYDLARKFPVLNSSGWDYRINMDGFLTFQRVSDIGSLLKVLGYTQIFRNGCLEATVSGIVSEHQGKYYLNTDLLYGLSSSACDFLQSLSEMGVNTPLAIALTLHGVKHAGIFTNNFAITCEHSVGVDTLLAPTGLLESFEPKDCTDSIKKCLDYVWNACGYPKYKPK